MQPDRPDSIFQEKVTLGDRLKEIINWVSERDHSRAIELDAVVHRLEEACFMIARAECASVLHNTESERDAAWADLDRIKEIVLNPLKIAGP